MVVEVIMMVMIAMEVIVVYNYNSDEEYDHSVATVIVSRASPYPLEDRVW